MMKIKMSMIGKDICRFCLKIVGDQNFDINRDITLEILNVLSIKMDLSIDGKYLMCRECRATMQRCFNFKSTCICSEDSIAEYITEGSKLDLEEVYFKQKLNQSSKKIPKGQNICRLCMKITSKAKCLYHTDEFIALINDKLQKYIPELNINAVKYPMICEACLESIQSYSAFVTCCLDVEKNISRYSEARGVDKRHADLYKVLRFIQNETLESDISKCAVSRGVERLDFDQTNININCMEVSATEINVKMEKNEVELEDRKSYSGKKISGNSKTKLIKEDQVVCSGEDQFIINEDINCNGKEHDLDKEENNEILFSREVIDRENIIKNEEIEIKSEAENRGNKDSETQDNTLQTKSYKKGHYKVFCEICSANFSNKYVLANHKSCIHRKDRQVRIFKCDQCPFVTRYKESIKNHGKVHTNISELKMYKCKECKFETKYKNNIKAHALARHQSSEVLIPHKQELERKIPSVRSEVSLFSCDLCHYMTKFKRHLRYHEMTHKNKSELTTYDCYHCTYKAKRKTHLREHMVKHKKQELMPNKCNIRDSETNPCAANDLLVQKEQSETQFYYCHKCSFATSFERKLKDHLLTHINSSRLKKFESHEKHSSTPRVVTGTRVYKCMHCSYRSTAKFRFKMHLYNIHNDNSLGTLPVFKCLLCSYQTIRKNNFERHTQAHGAKSDMELWKCDICGGEYSKFHVKRHQRTCVGQKDLKGNTYNGERIKKKST